MSQVINNQRKVEFDSKAFQNFLEKIFGAIPEISNKSATVAFISDRRMKELNNFFRGKNLTTDVLSFPHAPDNFGNSSASAEIVEGDDKEFLGDIVISAEQAERQAKENGLTLENEIEQLILHGILHLCGYDHETDSGEMNRLELKLRKKLGI
ncbi:MAG TPA: rRNA maturation RNase YbeY [Pyrinomonadaceae bacterium]|jgi:probable rRNA maturation factor|nr:rRNA maturation RNase YbeY [Pyrinomonadaceae bacterium]